MKVVCIADPHGNQNGIDLPTGDLLVIAGDLTVFGDISRFGRFGMWLERVAPMYPYGTVVIAGNHDIGLDPRKSPNSWRIHEEIIKGPSVHYLNDSQVVINGYKIWGSPITPEFCNWAFNRDRGLDIDRHWKLIPNDTDILITHGPPAGILDGKLGCEDLRKRIDNMQLKLHVFGHIHWPYGKKTIGSTQYVNAALCDIVKNRYVLAKPPIVVEV